MVLLCALQLALLSVSAVAQSIGTNSSVIRGEGNVLGATLALDGSNKFRLQVFCRNNRAEGTKELMLSMYVNNDAKV